MTSRTRASVIDEALQYGLSIRHDPFRDLLVVTRLEDGVRVDVYNEYTLKGVLKQFRDYDAAQATPSHWMAL